MTFHERHKLAQRGESGQVDFLPPLRETPTNAINANMLNAYVGIVSRDGLNFLHVERTDTVRRIGRSAGAGKGIGFWAVIPEAEAQVVRFLLGAGEQDSALLYLDRTARDIGRLTPNR